MDVLGVMLNGVHRNVFFVDALLDGHWWRRRDRVFDEIIGGRGVKSSGNVGIIARRRAKPCIRHQTEVRQSSIVVVVE